MNTSSKKPSALPVFFSTLMLAAAHCLGQGVIGGNQNGLGAGGYLPQPTATGTTSLPAVQAPVVTSLGMPGYHFELVAISGQPVKVVIDPQQPIVLPLATVANAPTAVAPAGPGFLASFDLANNSPINRVFEFVDQYYANIKIAFTVFDHNGDAIWQSYQVQVDIPPLAPKAHLTLGKYSRWHKSVFVPLHHADGSLLKPGRYTLQAEVIGTPEYKASAQFRVTTLVGGPIIVPIPLSGAK